MDQNWTFTERKGTAFRRKPFRMAAELGLLFFTVLLFWHGTDTGSRLADTPAMESDTEQTWEETKRIAITFDDGPHEKYTKQLLDGLKTRGVKAAFFVIGENAEKNPDLILRMSEEGHLIGNHTYHHVCLTKKSIPDACSEISLLNDLIQQITGSVPCFLRPPYGEWNSQKYCGIAMIPVLWDVDPLDWNTMDAAIVAERVLKKVKNGDIILLHDVYQSSVQAAFRIIDELQSRGYEFVTVDQLILD